MKSSHLMLVIFLLVPAWTFAKTNLAYRIKHGETVTDTLYKLGIEPIYGLKGNLVRTLSLNPHIRNRTKTIKPGTILYIGLEHREAILKVAHITDDGEIKTGRSTANVEESHTQSAGKEILQSTSTNSSDSGPAGDLWAGPNFAFSQIIGKQNNNGSTATLNSGLTYAIDFGWRQYWSESFSTALFGNITRENFYNSKSISIDNRNMTRARFGMETSYNYGPDFKLSASFSYGQELWYRALSTENLEFININVPDIRLRAQPVLFRKKSLALSALIEGRYLLGANSEEYKLDSGIGYKAGLEITRTGSGNDFGCGNYFSQYQQDSNLLKYERKDVQFSCFIRWRHE